ASKHARLTFCYEAGPTGYGLYRLIKSIAHDCIVVAPLLVPPKQGERIERVEQAMRQVVSDWTLAPVIEAVQAMRGIDMVGAVAFLAELGDLSRFENPRQLMAYLGLTPSERSTGESVKRGGITKAGNTRARRLLIEAA